MGSEHTTADDGAARPGDEPHGVRRQNRLAAEPSLYLRQHGDNPIDWYPWGDEALARARALDRPIFLSVGYAACHWCHVMEREVFTSAEVAALLNRSFVCIKVDREERPDLDAAYMEALQALSGGGGWPMSLFLTPEQQPFFGGTYFPRASFLNIARRVDEVFRGQRAALEEQARLLAQGLKAALPGGAGELLDERALDVAAERTLLRVDDRWGGATGRMKFPTPPRWELLLRRYRRTGEERYARAVRTTLDQMASGGIQDHVGGGFHRYAVEETWVVPHFEKLLDDNAQLASLYLEGSVALDEPRHAEVARDVLDFLLRELGDPAGGLHASLDADSGGEEGSYYVWTPAELAAVAGPTDGAALAALLDVTAAGNFDGRSVLTRRRPPAVVARELDRDPVELATLLARWRPALRERRDARPRPARDRKVVSSWNGMAIAALARGARLLDEPRYAAAASRAADFVWDVHGRPDGTLARASTDGVTRGTGVLDDYANVALGLLELFQTTQALQPLRRALALLETARARFAHPAGGFYLTPDGHEAPLGRQQELFDSVRPSGSAALLTALVRAAALRGDPQLLEPVQHALRAQAALLRQAPVETPAWHAVAQELLGPFHSVVLAGPPDAPRTTALRGVVRRLHAAHVVLIVVGEEGPSAEQAELLPPTRGKRVAAGQEATAHVCGRGSCAPPTDDPTELRRQLLVGWTR